MRKKEKAFIVVGGVAAGAPHDGGRRGPQSVPTGSAVQCRMKASQSSTASGRE